MKVQLEHIFVYFKYFIETRIASQSYISVIFNKFPSRFLDILFYNVYAHARFARY